MKKGLLKILLIAALIAVLAGCKKENGSPNTTDGTKTPLSISSALLAKVVTKSGTVITTGGKIGVFQTATTGGYSAQNNVEYDYVSSAWTVAVPANTIYLNNNNASVCAYYPYNAAITSATNVALTSQLYSSANDLSFAISSTVRNAAPSANLTMNHAYSQITFKLQKDPTYTGTGAISQIVISNTGILSGNTLDITSGTYGTGTRGQCYI